MEKPNHAGLIHTEGNLYYRDVYIPEDVILLPDAKQIMDNILEHNMRDIRAWNYFIYKLEQMELSEYERMMQHLDMKYRLYCVRLGEPRIILLKPRGCKMGVMNL